MKLKKEPRAVCFLFVFAAAALFADSFSEGKELFRMNKPLEAIPLLVQALSEENVPPETYIYLGLAYYQTGQLRQSVDTFLAGAEKSGTNKRVLYYNAGNAAFKMGNFSEAEELFSFASAADPNFAGAVLNKANAQLKQDKLEEAAVSYETYLEKKPDAPQADAVKKIIAAISDELNARSREKERLALEAERLKAEEARIAAEKEARRQEEERLAAERAAAEAERLAAAAERRRQLLEEVSASLQAAGSENISAGTEGVMGYDYESELD